MPASHHIVFLRVSLRFNNATMYIKLQSHKILYFTFSTNPRYLFCGWLWLCQLECHKLQKVVTFLLFREFQSRKLIFGTGIVQPQKIVITPYLFCCESGRPWLHFPKGWVDKNTPYSLQVSRLSISLSLSGYENERVELFTKWGVRYNRITRFQHADLYQMSRTS
jgi:hypothetical protein